MSLRHSFSSSRLNRDRREDSFARSVIAEAQRRHLEQKAEALEAAEAPRCPVCGREMNDGDSYCTTRCAIDAEVESRD